MPSDMFLDTPVPHYHTREVTGSSPVSPIFVSPCKQNVCEGFLCLHYLFLELIAFSFMQYLCRMMFPRASSASFLVPICDQHVKFPLVESEMSRNFSGVLCSFGYQSVHSFIRPSQSQPVETYIDDGLMYPVDWGSLRLRFCLCVFHD